MPQMMPIYWLVICLMVNLFLHFFISFYYYDLNLYSKCLSSGSVSIKNAGEWKFLK